MTKTVVGLFSDSREAERAFEDLVNAGFSAKSISVVTNASAQRDIESHSPLRFSAVSLGDVGNVAAAGPLRDALSETKEAAPTLILALKRLGLSSDLAERYASGVRSGDTLESLIVDEADSERAVALMKRPDDGSMKRPDDGRKVAPMRAAAGVAAAGADAAKPSIMDSVREEIETAYEKREARSEPAEREVREAGYKPIPETPASEPVILREEHIAIERHPVDVERSEIGDEAVVAKEARVVEEVAPIGGFDEAEYRRDFDEQQMGGTFEEQLPAYQLGHELRQGDGSSSGRWEDAEKIARTRWEAKNPGTWDKFKNSIRLAWSGNKSR